MSFKLKLKIFNDEYDLVTESLVSSKLENIIQDFAWEIITDLIYSYSPKANGNFGWHGDYADEAYSFAQQYIENHKDECLLYVLDNNGKYQPLTIDVSKPLQNIIIYTRESENYDFDGVSFKFKSLENFIKQGVWQFGLQKPSGAIVCGCDAWPKPIIDGDRIFWRDGIGEYMPILWFGLVNEEPIDHWSIYANAELFKASEKEMHWQDFWYSEDWGIDDEDWYYHVEGGIDYPSFDSVRQSCPIELNEDDTAEELLAKVEQFVLKNIK